MKKNLFYITFLFVIMKNMLYDFVSVHARATLEWRHVDVVNCVKHKKSFVLIRQMKCFLSFRTFPAITAAIWKIPSPMIAAAAK